MRAGDLRHRIRLQHRSETKDALNQPSTSWTDVATLWAEVQPLTGRKLMVGQAIHSEVTHMISIRYQAQFASPREMAKMRILYNDRIFNIHASIDVEERHKIIEMSCSEGLNDG